MQLLRQVLVLFLVLRKLCQNSNRPKDLKQNMNKLWMMSVSALLLMGWVSCSPSTSEKSASVREEVLQKKSLAVLPLLNTNTDPEQKYFSDGISEEIISHLNDIKSIDSVVAWPDIMNHQKGDELEINYGLEGTVSSDNDSITISARFLEVKNGEVLWSDTYQRPLNEVFKIQADMVKQMAKTLEIEITSRVLAKIEKAPTSNLEAYDLYLNGKYHYYQSTDDEIKKAIEFLNQAVALDANFSMAYLHLGYCYWSLAEYEGSTESPSWEKTQWALNKAVEVDSTNSRAQDLLLILDVVHGW